MKNLRLKLQFLYFLIICLNYFSLLSQTDGTLDTTFNNTGKLISDFGFPYDYNPSAGCKNFELQTDGKIILVGKYSTGNLYSPGSNLIA